MSIQQSIPSSSSHIPAGHLSEFDYKLCTCSAQTDGVGQLHRQHVTKHAGRRSDRLHDVRALHNTPKERDNCYICVPVCATQQVSKSWGRLFQKGLLSSVVTAENVMRLKGGPDQADPANCLMDHCTRKE